MGTRLGCYSGSSRVAQQGIRSRRYRDQPECARFVSVQPKFPVCVAFGHEVEGLRPDLLQFADTHVRIPMLGKKTSLNVATAAGVVLYELLRKYHAQSIDRDCAVRGE